MRAQGPLALGRRSEPEPDIAVVQGTIDDFPEHPQTAVLVVEVSHSSLSFDRTDKANLYAGAGIAGYWIVNLVDRRLEVYRSPVATPTARFGFEYKNRQIFQPGESVAPLAISGRSVAVSDFLP